MTFKGVVLKHILPKPKGRRLNRPLWALGLSITNGLQTIKSAGSRPRSTCFPDIRSEYFKDFPFLESIDGKALVCSLEDQEKAVKRLGTTTDLSSLRFKSKRDHWQSYRTWGVSLNREKTRIDLPIVGSIKVKGFFGSYSKIVSASIKRTPPGEYYIVLTLEFKSEPRPNKGGQIGIDVGLDLYSVDSNGHENNNPQYYEKSLKKLKRMQRSLARKAKDSKNYEKQRRRLAKVHAKIANQRNSIRKYMNRNDYWESYLRYAAHHARDILGSVLDHTRTLSRKEYRSMLHILGNMVAYDDLPVEMVLAAVQGVSIDDGQEKKGEDE